MSANYADGYHMFTSEAVSPGHPDKVADQVSDAILDSLLTVEPDARCACETLVTTGLVVIAGEVRVSRPAAVRALENVEDTVRNTLRGIGYTDPTMRFDADSCAVIRTLHSQSADIAKGVDKEGAGDQGLMFGFACKETPNLMPLTIELSHALMKRHVQVREKGIIKGLRPDAKSQVTIEYDADRPKRVHTVVLSTQHEPQWTGKKQQAKLKDLIIKHVIKPVMPARLFNAKDCIIHMNPTGAFEIGGPHGDAGLTGRKIIVDTYGGRGCHGGGAFSGKDATKVDRSASYMARYVAKNIVAAGLATRCEVQLSYAIGVKDPLSVLVTTEGTGVIPDEEFEAIVRDIFPLTPRGIIEHLKLRRPIYERTARHGHFGHRAMKDGGFSWENTNMVRKLRKAAGL
ncbi:MAG: methionine adenosyltransferase [Candidatus Eisenbacteria bacterium]